MLIGDSLRRIRGSAVQAAIHAGARITRPLTMGVRAVLLDPQGRVLLVRQGYLPGWQFPGGGVEPGESVAIALARETREEANVAIRGEPAFHGVFLNRRRDHVLVYVVRDFDRLGDRPPDWEIREVAFFEPNALPEGTSGATRRRIAEIVDGVARAETW